MSGTAIPCTDGVAAARSAAARGREPCGHRARRGPRHRRTPDQFVRAGRIRAGHAAAARNTRPRDPGAGRGLRSGTVRSPGARPAVALASPVLEVDLGVCGSCATPRLRLLASTRSAPRALQPALVGGDRRAMSRAVRADALVLSRSAAAAARRRARRAARRSMPAPARRRCASSTCCPTDAYAGELGIMDIGAAQWTLGRLGRLNRIDLRLRPAIDPEQARARLAQLLPPGVFAVTAQASAAAPLAPHAPIASTWTCWRWWRC